MSEDEPQPEQNPYAAPAHDAEDGSVRFELHERVRGLISTTGTLMIVASLLEILASASVLVREGLSFPSMVGATMFGVIPTFVAIAGFWLRRVAAHGELETLLTGFRQLYVAFLIKGLAMCLVIGLFLLGLAMMFLGVGVDFAKLF